MHHPVIRLICVSDCILPLFALVIEPDDLIAAFPDLGLTIFRVRDGLSHSKKAAAQGGR
jgi:hypothetical protein